MKTKLLPQYALIFGVLFVNSAFPLSSADMPPDGARTIPLPVFAVGDWWIDSKGVKLEIVEIAGDVITATQGGQRSTYTKEFNKIEGPAAKTGYVATYSPFIPTISFPLWTGKKWDRVVSWTSNVNGKLYNGTFEYKATVGDWETVALKSGRADSQVEAIRVNATSTDNRGTTSMACWYAPIAKRVIKCESSEPTYAFSLIEFGPPKGPR